MNHEKFLEYERRAYSTVYAEGENTYHDNIIVDFAKRFLPEMNIDKKGLVLDIGCGPGTFLQAARDLGYRNTIGVTLSELDVDACKKKKFKTIKSSMSDLDVKDNSVDLIWCRHAIEHSPFPLFTLYEFHRVLKLDAHVWIEVPSPDNTRAFMHEFNPNHYSILGNRMWLGLFEKAGFECIADYNYNIDVEVPSGKVNEKSYIFVLRRSQVPIAETFKNKYGIEIND